MKTVYYLRKRCGLSRIELAKRLNSMYDCSINRKRLMLIECGFEEMNEATAKMLAEFFNVAVEVIKENKRIKK
ncbi:hypothetical protein [Staphylococcus pseudoxylosus]|uniref:hypothetical protein n=1 Tax=Staphylococcus pseudoxylosus TaxID=2282419 RepID=UPI00298F0617|nr:hypothetical protein [Staphylococcus pseudoxylosus]MDW8544577.1 hypothetical protein [Staphylococcus pseudoxylosus]